MRVKFRQKNEDKGWGDISSAGPKPHKKRVLSHLTQDLGLCYSGGMKKDSLWPAVTVLILYTGLLFGAFSWMLKAQIQPIKEILTNHITDTNKKIDDLRQETNSRFDKLNERFDRLNERFDSLYELLLKDKQNKSSK